MNTREVSVLLDSPGVRGWQFCSSELKIVNSGQQETGHTLEEEIGVRKPYGFQ